MDDLSATALLVAGATTSPELSSENLAAGRPSTAMDSILHWCAASAMGVDLAKIQLSDTKLISHGNLTGRGLIFFDISFSLCASGTSQLVSGSIFERRFAEAWQSFAAFPVTSVKVLELQDRRSASQGGHHGIMKQARSQPLAGGQSQKADNANNDISVEQFLWIGPALGVALLLLACVTCRWVRQKYKNKGSASPRHWGGVAPGAHLQQHSPSQAVPQGPGGGSLASITYDFDPNTADGMVFAASGGLEPSECLKASKGELIEAFARGDGWLYGRLSSTGLFGYLPELCVLWIDGVGDADALPVFAAALGTAVGTVTTATLGGEVMGRPAPPVSLPV